MTSFPRITSTLACLSIAMFCATSTNAASVPFLSQAPTGQWRDLRQGQGCEEAVALMAVAWANGQTLTKTAGRKAIIAMSDWEKKHWGYFVDTSIEDTADRLFRQYLNYNKIETRRIISTYDIQDALRFGDLAVVAINGRVLGEPYYRASGPRHHMLLVTGYDESTDSFIVNDPGTYRGANIKIPREKLQHALQDYPSGDGTSYDKLPPAMIVVNR